MRAITTTRAQDIASDWNSGLWCPLHQFASGVFIPADAPKYLQAVQRGIDKEGHQPTAQPPTTRQMRALKSLKRYFEFQSAKAGHKVTKWEQQGYELLPIFDNIDGLNPYMTQG